jgi:hypothetical protein
MSSGTIFVSTVSISQNPRKTYFHVCAADASFAENFYGLKRRRRPFVETERARAAVGGVPIEEKLRDREVWRSLIVLVRNFGSVERNC